MTTESYHYLCMKKQSKTKQKLESDHLQEVVELLTQKMRFSSAFSITKIL